jgi:ATP-dependent Clp protease ATP-binding subunit ClpE
MCSICKENYAVVFITKIVDGRQTQEGLCLSCAKKQGIQPVNQLIEQTGMTEEDIDNLNKQMSSLFENMDPDIGNSSAMPAEPSGGNKPNPFFSFLNRAFPKNEDSGENNEPKDPSDEKENKSGTRT